MRFLFILSLSILLSSCSDKYDKYKTTPEYVTNATGSDKSYFEAYNETLKLWDVSFEELYIPTANGMTHVIVSGPENAEPLVLLHGLNASSTMWFPNIKALSKNHRVFAIDFILEPGKSYLKNDIESVEKINTWYNEVFLGLELDSFHLIGASRGGWMAVNYTLDNQEKVKSLILLSPAQTFTWIKPSKGLLKNIGALFSSKEKQVQKNLETMSSNVENISDAYINQYKIATEKDSVNKFMITMQPFSIFELNSLKMKFLVLIGDNDMINEKETAVIANSLPRGKAEIIKNAGHFLSIDQSDVVNEKMLDFLK